MNNPGYILVIGGSNADLTGIPQTKFVPRDSNPGQVSISAGGVGRNIAENIARLDCRVSLLSAVGNDSFGAFILDECRAAGVGTSQVVICDDRPTSTYMCIMDENHDLYAAVSDMEITSRLSPELIQTRSNLLKNAAAVVIDNNISPETIEAVKNTARRKILFDAVSGKKLLRSKEHICNMDTVKLNALEAEILSGIKITDPNKAKQASEKIAARGIKNVFISLGAEGAHYRCAEGCFFTKPFNLPLKNTTGAGDAFIAGIVCGDHLGLTGQDLLDYGSACAAVAAASERTVSKKINRNNINLVINGEINEF